MKFSKSILPLLFSVIFISMHSCGGGKSSTIDSFDKETASHQRIAVLPFSSKIKLRKKQRDELTKEEIIKLEIAQGIAVQNAVESNLLGRKLKVRVQSQSVTNSKLKSHKLDFKNINEIDVTRLCTILGVDAVVSGQIETDQPMSDELARGLNIAKKLAWDLSSTIGAIGRNVKTTTNKGWCTMNLFESTHGDRLWSYRNDLEMGQGSEIQDVINKLMVKGAKKFPYNR